MKERIREITARSGGRSLAQVVTRAAELSRGLAARTFGWPTRRSVFAQVDEVASSPPARDLTSNTGSEARPSFASYGAVACLTHVAAMAARFTGELVASGWHIAALHLALPRSVLRSARSPALALR